ncbi:metallophosphoesterase [Companilactobacillus mishanensis]|uniref:metallophosphoesterase n=1 Tax=Companilactobacillus mishanensis TaxID=2486008 RepID=UPI001296F2C9|nr:metallophosphoesterase [Companilactobacillus mishanensis]MQS89395.1 metallophosphoesterase [Companilactobacillus mishanensis]
MKTILVGDIHLKARIMLPLVDQVVHEQGAQQIILMGDYLDDYGCTEDARLYLDELNFLIDWKIKMEASDIKIISLLGNHDAPYLTGELRGYSLKSDFNMLTGNQDISDVISDKLLKLGVQVAFQLDDFLVSHAGYCRGIKQRKWHLRPITMSDKDLRWVSELDNHIGSRGGFGYNGSPIWADFRDLVRNPSLDVTNQIVGHTPQSTIIFDEEKDVHYQLVDIDTFTLRFEEETNQYKYIGDGSLLLYSNGELESIATNWMNKDNLKVLMDQRHP